MRLVKWLVPATLAMAVALSLVGGASPAMAESTVLCKVEESPCAAGNKWENTGFVAKAIPLKLLTSLGTVECGSSRLQGALGVLNAPQGVGLESLTFAECKMGMIGCTLKATGLGGIALLRTAANGGEATLTNTSFSVECSLVHCVYEGEPVLGLAGKTGLQHATLIASELALTTIGGAFCPKTTKLDAEYTILEPLPAFVQS